MEKLALRGIMYGADKIPDSWFDKVPGGYYRAKDGQQPNGKPSGQPPRDNRPPARRPRRYTNDYDGSRRYNYDYDRRDPCRDSRTGYYDGDRYDDNGGYRRQGRPGDRSRYSEHPRRRSYEDDERRFDYEDESGRPRFRTPVYSDPRMTRRPTNGPSSATQYPVVPASPPAQTDYVPPVQPPPAMPPPPPTNGAGGSPQMRYVPYANVYGQGNPPPPTASVGRGGQPPADLHNEAARPPMSHLSGQGSEDSILLAEEGHGPRHGYADYHHHDYHDDKRRSDEGYESDTTGRQAARRRDSRRESDARVNGQGRYTSKHGHQTGTFDMTKHGAAHAAVGAAAGGIIGSALPGPGTAVGAALGAAGANAFGARERYESSPSQRKMSHPGPPIRSGSLPYRDSVPSSRRVDYRSNSGSSRHSGRPSSSRSPNPVPISHIPPSASRRREEARNEAFSNDSEVRRNAERRLSSEERRELRRARRRESGGYYSD